MKASTLYLILGIIGGFFISSLIVGILSVGISSVLYLFVFGDDPWPSILFKVGPILGILLTIGLWGFIIWLSYHFGKKAELNKPKL